MEQIYVGHTLLSVDIVGELEPYFTDGYKVRWTEEKLSAPSPFRYEKKPSFFVNLTHLEDKKVAGTWIDSGTGETGKLESLLCFLRNETLEETVQYLREKYEVKAYDKLSLSLDFKMKADWKPILFQGDEFVQDYRGLSNEVLRNAGVMYLGDKIVFHWYNPQGVIVAIKYRYLDRKEFYYEKGGKRLNEQLYNIRRVYEESFTSLWICEGEVDALSVESIIPRFVGVAMGGASFSDKQRDTIIRTGIPNVVIATDNDKQGEKVAKEIQRKLEGFVTLWRVELMDCKDVNEFIQTYHKLPKLSQLTKKPLFTGFSQFS